VLRPTPLRITGVRAITCEIPLTRPIVMGDLRFDAREYVLVMVETDAGITGLGFGMTRNAPVAAIVERNLAPLLLGEDPLMTEALWERLYYRNLTIAGRGIFMRALSAIDIALWDVKARALGQPIWRLLGGARETVPLTVAGGYVADDKTLDDLAREVDDYARRGFSLVKIAAGELAADTERLRVALDALAGRADLAYDAHWAWRDLHRTVPTVARWRDFGLAFLEDPFAPELVRLAPQLRAETGLPLALGEDAVGRWAFQDLFDLITPDVLRIDATTMGGISEAIKVCALASIHARPVLPHVFPEIHVHLGAAFPAVSAVEMTVPDYELELLFRLFRDWVTVEDGNLRAPETAGLGLTLDDAAVARYRVDDRRVTVSDI
jgi:L-alanine-DL-glutamate epimerase-like enolase superfamily enzyme